MRLFCWMELFERGTVKTANLLDELVLCCKDPHMKNKAFTLFFSLTFVLLSANTQAKTVYSLKYDPASPIKSVSLKNASVMIEIYDYGIPRGYYEVKTDANQSFSLNDQQDLEVVSINGEEKYRALCSGNPGKNNMIAITCEKRD